MENNDIVNGVSKLLWFVYRITFTIVPSTIFMGISLLTFRYVASQSLYKNYIDTFTSLSPTGQIFAFIAVAIFLHYIIEAFVIKIAYRTFDFKGLSDNEFHELRKRYLNPQGIRNNIKMPSSMYNLMEVLSLKKNDRVFEHIEYTLGREFMFNNTWAVMLLCMLLYFPIVFSHHFPLIKNQTNFWFVFDKWQFIQLLEIVFVPGILVYAAYFIRKHFTEEKYYHFKNFETRKKIDWWKKFRQIIPVVCPAALGLAMIVCIQSNSANQLTSYEYFFLFLGYNLTFLSIAYFLINSGLREYFTVDKIVYSYFLLEYRDKKFISDDSKEFTPMDWYFRKTTSIDDEYFKNEIANDILRIFKDGMEMEGWSIDKIVDVKKNSTHIGLLENQQNGEEKRKIFGYCLVTIPEQLHEGKSVLWIDTCCIEKKFQENGFYETAIEKLLLLKKFGWVGGRTQNPVIFYLLDKKSAKSQGKLFPFDNGNKFPEPLMNFLVENIPQVKKHSTDTTLFSKTTGIIKQVYREGVLGKYPINFRKGRSIKFEAKLNAMDFNRLNGDSIIVLKKIV